MMNNEIVRNETPEEKELNRKLAELEELKSLLSKRELDLATLKASLRIFEAKYLRIVGSRFAELDEIKAQIAETEAHLNPRDAETQQKATQAREQATESARAASETQDKDKKGFEPTETLRKLYREVAKRVHPDLAADEKDRILRERLMADANRAFEEGDEDKLRAIIEEWENSPESVRGGGISADLVRAIRKIEQLRKRLSIIEIETNKLETSDLYHLMTEMLSEKHKGKDLLADMASKIVVEIVVAKKRLAEIKKRRNQT